MSSPLQRCMAFSDALAEKLGTEATADERLREIGFGDWEGKTPDLVQDSLMRGRLGHE